MAKSEWNSKGKPTASTRIPLATRQAMDALVREGRAANRGDLLDQWIADGLARAIVQGEPEVMPTLTQGLEALEEYKRERGQSIKVHWPR